MYYTAKKWVPLLLLCVGVGGAGFAASPTIGPLAPNEVYTGLINAEYALTQGDVTTSINKYIQLGDLKKDPRFYQRATLLAVQNQQLQLAEAAAADWAKLSANDLDANYTYTILLIGNQANHEIEHQLGVLLSFDLTDDYLQSLISILAIASPNYLNNLNGILTKLEDSNKNLQNVYLLKAVIASTLDRKLIAIDDAKKLIRLKPDWPLASQVYTQLLINNNQKKEAGNFLQNQIEKYANNPAFKLQYANYLITNDQKNAARKLLTTLDKSPQTHIVATYMLAALSLSENKFIPAKKYLSTLLSVDQYKDYANFYLGQIAESEKDNDQAIKYYSSAEGDYYFKAKLKQATLLSENNQLEDAIDLLDNTNVNTDDEVNQVVLLQASLFITHKNYQEALSLLNRAIEQVPDNLDFLYARTTVTYALDRKDLAENDLRKIIAIDPQQLDALIGLGYLLSETPNREQEALGFAEQAFALAPKQPQVLDTIGWIEFKMGNYQKALHYLKQSYAIKPDSTTAAHLFQTLVKEGKLGDAKIVLDSALQNAPDDQQLKEMYQQLKH